MKVYNIKELNLKLKVPESRSEISYEQWDRAYTHMADVNKARELYEENKYNEAASMSLYAMCNVLAELTDTDVEVIKRIDADQITVIFINDLDFIQNEKPKTKFVINGVKFEVPKFEKRSAGDFMDLMSIIQGIETDYEIGLNIVAVYLRLGEYNQDLEAINKRKEFIKKYGKMDLFYSVAFFLSSSLVSQKFVMQQHIELVKELEKQMSTLGVWVTILYLQALQKQEF